MLTAHHLSKSFDFQKLFENVSFSLNPGERLGLVGPNGCGKTTLLRILSGLETPDHGHVKRDAHLRIGYLPQGFELDGQVPIREAIGRIAGNPVALEEALAETAQALSRAPDDAQLQYDYDTLLARISFNETGRAANVLAALGLDSIDPTLPIGRLSGGQQTRLALAFVLLANPQLLLLDEPTNHLDIAMLEWLEDWLAASPCGMLIVSHDRTFLDRTVQRILEMDPVRRTVRQYSGNFSDYQKQRRTEIEQQWADYQDQQSEIRRMRQDITRVKSQAAHTERQASSIRIGGSDYKMKGYKSYQQGIAKKVAKKAKSREKKLERFLNSGERVEKPSESKKIKLSFNEPDHFSRVMISLEELFIGYNPSAPLLKEVSLEVASGMRIVITGPNGSGKTTLLRTIAGELPALQGKVRLGASARLGYLKQDQSNLDMRKNAVEILAPLFPNDTETRTFLAYFLLTGDEALKPTGLLSYGQRTRLMLAILVAEGCNCLLLDEPINHLDIPSREQFEQALRQFNGAVLAVVHDRYFIERFAEEIWWVEDQQIRRDYVRIPI